MMRLACKRMGILYFYTNFWLKAEDSELGVGTQSVQGYPLVQLDARIYENCEENENECKKFKIINGFPKKI